MVKQWIVKEYFLLVKLEEKWWMVPLLAVLAMAGFFVVFPSSSPLAPFLYRFF